MNNPRIDFCAMPQTQIGTRIYVDINKKYIYGVVVDSRHIEINGVVYTVSQAARKLKYEAYGKISGGWKSCLRIADGRKVFDLWNSHLKQNTNDNVTTKTKVSPLYTNDSWLNFLGYGDAVVDTETNTVGYWVDVEKKIIFFSGYPPMTAAEWIKRNYKKSKSNWKYHFVDVKSGKLFRDIELDYFYNDNCPRTASN